MKLQVGFAVLLLSVLPAVGQKKADIEAGTRKALDLVGKPAPNFTLGEFQLSDKRGQVVVLAFWATWCPPCRAEMPGFAKLQKELSPGVAVIPVAFDHEAAAREFLVKKHLEMSSLFDDQGESQGKVAGLYGAHAIPKTFVIDKNGVVVKAFTSKTSEAELRRAIEAAGR
jgi:peroxiredoxin